MGAHNKHRSNAIINVLHSGQMPNTFIPAKDVARVLEDLGHEAMRDNFPDLVRGTKEYDETLAKVLLYTFGGLFYGPMPM